MTLSIVRNLLDDFHSNGINYCHWKSNEHLEAAVNADTDLDVLFDNKQRDLVTRILEQNGFHLFEAVWYRKYEGIVDYIGFDKQSGKIVHVHTHFHLDIGEVGVKSYRLPWEDLVLDNKVYNEEFKIYTSSPEVEYLLLIVRTSFKYSPLNKKQNRSIGNHFNIEAKWLRERAKVRSVLEYSNKMLGEEMTVLVKGILESGNYNESLFVSLKKLLKSYLAEYRLIKTSRVKKLQLIHFFKQAQYKLGIVFKFPVRRYKRHLPQKGIIVSLMGSDGAGKSTQTKEITKELNKKVDVLFMYMGSGDGSKSLHRKFIELIFSLRGGKEEHKSSNKLADAEPKQKKLSSRSFIKQFLLSIKAISLAYEKKSKLKRIEKERRRGTIVICDRYPQTSIMGYNDGPKLSDNLKSSNLILRTLARYEFESYELAKEIYPNLVVKLIGSLDVLHARRPEMTREEINKKQNGIINLKFDAPTQVETIDIDKPIIAIKGEILDLLSSKMS